MKKYFKNLALLLLSLTLAVMIIGTVFADESKPFEGTTVKFLRHSGYGADWMRSMIPAFEEETGIKVEMDTISYNNMYDKQVIELSSKSGTHDIYTIPDYWTGQYTSGGWLTSLDKFINSDLYNSSFDINDIPESLLKLNSYNGELFVMPFKYNTRLLFYRKDIFNEKNLSVPTTWDEMQSVAASLTKNDFYGIDLSLNPENLTDLFHDFLSSAGGKFFKDDLKAGFNDTAGVEAVEFMKNLLNYAPKGSLGRSWPETSNLMAQGKIGMAFLIPSFAGELNNPEKSFVAGKIGFTTIPANKYSSTYVSSWGIGISSSSKNPEAAYLFIQWLLSKERIKDFTIATRGGIIPARKSILLDSEILGNYPQMQAAKKAAEGAWMWPSITTIPQIKKVFSRNIQQALIGEKSIEKALEDAAKEVDTIMEKAGY